MPEVSVPEHPSVQTDSFRSIEDYCLYLIHLKAYEEAARIADGRAVLDIGCSNGYGSSILATRARRVIGLDLSHAAILDRRACGTTRRLGFVVGDAAALPFKQTTFDVVTAFQVIEHVPEPAKVLSGIRAVLSPNGVAIFTTPNSRIRLLRGQKPWNEHHVREYEADELRHLLSMYFEKVTVQGLFAAEPVNTIERSRVARERNRGHGGIGMTLVGALKERMPRELKHWVRTLRGSVVGATLVRSFMREHKSTECLYLCTRGT